MGDTTWTARQKRTVRVLLIGSPVTLAALAVGLGSLLGVLPADKWPFLPFGLVFLAALAWATANLLRERRERADLPDGPARTPPAWGLDPSSAEADLLARARTSLAVVYAFVAAGRLPAGSDRFFTARLLQELPAAAAGLEANGSYRAVMGLAAAVARSRGIDAAAAVTGLARQRAEALMKFGGAGEADWSRIPGVSTGTAAWSVSVGPFAAGRTPPGTLTWGPVTGGTQAYSAKDDVLDYLLEWPSRQVSAVADAEGNRVQNEVLTVEWLVVRTADGLRVDGVRRVSGDATVANLLVACQRIRGGFPV